MDPSRDSCADRTTGESTGDERDCCPGLKIAVEAVGEDARRRRQHNDEGRGSRCCVHVFTEQHEHHRHQHDAAADSEQARGKTDHEPDENFKQPAFDLA